MMEYKASRFIATLFLVIIGLHISGCNTEPDVELPPEAEELKNLAVIPADAEPLHDISFEREAAYGETDGVMLGTILQAAVDRDGRVFLADIRQTALHLYNPDGTYNRQIGSEGEGPGEYRNLSSMVADESYLHLMDRNLNRITRYDLKTLEVAGEMPLPSDVGEEEEHYRYPVTFSVQSDTTYFFTFGTGYRGGSDESDEGRNIKTGLVHQNSGELLEYGNIVIPQSEALVHREDGGVMVMMMPYARKSLFSLQDNQFVHNWSDDFLFKWMDLEGKHLKAIYYALENMPLDRDEILQRYEDSGEQWQNMVRNADMPDTWPIVDSFHLDDEGRLWARIFTEEEESYGYKVVSESGDLLASFTWPENREISTIQNGSVYAFETDPDTGLRELVRYRYNIQDSNELASAAYFLSN